MCSKKPQKTNLHGLVSIILIFISMGIGIYAIAEYSATVALLNVLSILIFILSVSYYYCSKCTSRGHCNHWIFGRISKIITKPNPENYNTFDMLFGVVFPLIITIGLPQYWLLKDLLLLSVYWGLMVFSCIEIRYLVCTRCQNQKCSMCLNKITTLGK